MKKLFTLLVMLPVCAYAQRFEIGIGAGASINGQPTENMYYKGDVINPNYAASAIAVVNVNRWQFGANLQELGLSRKSNEAFPFYKGGTVGGDGKAFVYGKFTTSLSAIANYKLLDGKRSYVYAGAAIGGVITRQDKNKPMSTTEVTLTHQYKAPDGGIGVVGGLQLGYTYILTHRLSLNAEFAPRYYQLFYGAQAPEVKPKENLHYGILAYPLTVGIRFRMGYVKKGRHGYEYIEDKAINM